MELFYFTLGVFAVFALILIGVSIVGMVRVSKIQKELLSLNNSYRWDFDRLNRNLDDIRKDNELNVQNIYRNLDTRETALYIQIKKSFDESMSYTDKRIDKTILHYKES